MEPGSEAFLPTLELFLQSEEERKLLEQLEGSAAIHAADVIEKARDRGEKNTHTHATGESSLVKLGLTFS